MSETKMPAAEVNELMSYEFAFHVLPTVAEGEVARVFDDIKAHITKNGGELFDEEAPERFDLAYDVEKYLEGRNRKFSSAYFGWVRFKAEPANVDAIMEEIKAIKELLRHLLIKLTRIEEANPFRFHESIVSTRVVTIDTDEAAEVVDEEVAVVDPEIVEDGEEEKSAV
jgi:ribosomal protein S6